MITRADQLKETLKHLADQFSIRFRYDTHFEARNFELSWWAGRVYHRLDFQPDGETGARVTIFEDFFGAFPRFCLWAHSAIPNFPYLARIETRSSSDITFPIEERCIQQIIEQTVKPC